MSLSLIRIDDRMIHGQVVMTWIRYSQSRAVYLIDDKVASDPVQKRLLIMVAPTNVEVNVFSIEEAANNFEAWKNEDKKIMLIVRIPQTLLALSDLGLLFSEVNIGGIGAGPGKKKLHRNISVSPQEIETLLTLLDRGINLYIQVVPSEMRSEVNPLLLSK